MAGINRVGSPMDLIEDSSQELSKDVIEQKKKKLELMHRTNSLSTWGCVVLTLYDRQRCQTIARYTAFLIGSIEEVNRKISKLDRKLQQYTQLVVESRASQHEEDETLFIRPPSAEGRAIIERKEKEQKELNKFAGYYTMKQTFLPGRSERVRNISKISLAPSKTSQVTKKETGKPKFVELHQYPGYDPTELTDLPDEVPAREMLKNAAQAQMGLHKKPQYRPEFEKLFYSPMSQAVFQDIFWYIFLERYQPSKNAQIKLFNRTAFNYVKLMLYAKNPIYRDVFFKDYPSLISQAVYTGYCHCFPDSYRQFGEEFKEYMCGLVYGWIAGIKPAPRCWLKWNMDKLEPPNIKMREEILKARSKKSPTGVNFDFLDSLISSNISRYESSSTLSQSASNYSITSGAQRGRRKGLVRKKSGGVGERKSSGRRGAASSSSSSSHEIELSETPKSMTQQPERAIKKKPVDPRKLVEALTPIRETTFEDYEDSQMGSKSRQSEQLLKIMAMKAAKKEKVESHPACRGPDSVKSVFNIQGQSPLVAHFLRVKNLSHEAGQSILVQRTEQENLPPIDAPTYRDIMIESFRKVKKSEKEYQEMYDKSVKDSIAFGKHQRHMLKEHMRKQSALLAQPNEVKRLSDLLILEFRRDPDSISAGANAALEQALMAQD